MAITYKGKLIWEPQPGPQFLATVCPHDVIFYGGARGGGKTDCAIGRQILGAMKYGHAWNGMVVRKNYKNFAEIRRRIRELIRFGLPATLVGGDQQANYLRFDNGAQVQFMAFQFAQDLEVWQGQQYTELSIEEGTQFPFFMDMIDRGLACMRSPHGVPCTLFGTGNPGGAAHNQVKDMFIRPAAPFQVHYDAQGNSFVYIPAKVYDNRILCENDPVYVRRLEGIKNPELRRAWLEGDWDVVAGGFFSDIWKGTGEGSHVVPPFTPPMSWPRGMGFDWGSATPFSVGWYTVSDGSELKELGGRSFDRGAVIRYAEWYGCVKGRSNVGLRMDSRDVARRIREMEKSRGEGLVDFQRIGDPSIWSKMDVGPSVGEKMADEGVMMMRADREREAGWDECRYRLRGRQEGRPLFYVTENCRAFINTVPILGRDEDKWEDIDTDQEDHVADEWRYYMMARPMRPVREIDREEEFYDTYEESAFDPIAGY